MLCYGSLCYYRNIATHRGHIKKIKFGPGRGNNKLAVLFSDGMDIWDLQKVSSVHLLNKCTCNLKIVLRVRKPKQGEEVSLSQMLLEEFIL